MTEVLVYPQKELERRVPLAIENACWSVEVPRPYIQTYDEFSEAWTHDKHDSYIGYRIDGNDLVKRSTRGHRGQAAFEYYMGVKFTDLDPSFSFDKAVPDLRPLGLEIGIKTFKAPRNAPLIFVNSTYPEIFMMEDQHNPDLYYCLGIFGPKFLNDRDSICMSLVHDDNCRAKGTKIGFYPIDRGIPFKNMDELLSLTSKKWKTQLL